jgi:hypothetical protein
MAAMAAISMESSLNAARLILGRQMALQWTVLLGAAGSIKGRCR